jgi:hopanoid-associated phosphorylase
MNGFIVAADFCYGCALVRAGDRDLSAIGALLTAEQGHFNALDSPLQIAAPQQRDERLRFSDDRYRNLPSAQFAGAEASIVALVGLMFEARIAAGPEVVVTCRGAEADVAHTLRRAIRSGCRSVLSFGIAGGLDPDLRAGDCIIASDIADAHQLHPTDPNWARNLVEAIPGARLGRIAGVNSVASDVATKRDLYRRTRAVAVDMESHIAARIAADHKVAFAAIRVVLDPAHRALPEAAVLAANEDGSVNLAPVMRAIFGYPSQLPALVQLGLDAYAARSALKRLRRLLGPGFGLSRLSDDIEPQVPANQPVPV